MNIGYEAKRIFHNRTGLGNYGRDLVRMLSKYHPENTYYLYNPKPAVHRLFQSGTATVVERLPRSWFDRLFYNLWRQRNVIHDLRNDGIQLFHGLSGELPIGLSTRGIKSVVTIHDLIFLRYPELYSKIDRTIYFHKFKYAAHHADRVIAISEQTKRDVVDFLKVDANKVTVVYQGCHPAFKRQYSVIDKQAIRDKYGLPPDFILNVGTIETRKNALLIVKAIEHLDIHLVIAGKATPYVKELVDYMEKRQFTSKVTFIHGTTIDELAVLYQSALLFVYPSLFEGFGIPIIEALYSGVPVITSNTGCFHEAGGPHSCYVSPGDAEELSDALRTVLTDSKLRQRMIEGGFTYSQHFDDDRIADQLMRLYRGLVPTD